jgi:hypothetical protein
MAWRIEVNQRDAKARSPKEVAAFVRGDQRLTVDSRITDENQLWIAAGGPAQRAHRVRNLSVANEEKSQIVDVQWNNKAAAEFFREAC